MDSTGLSTITATGLEEFSANYDFVFNFVKSTEKLDYFVVTARVSSKTVSSWWQEMVEQTVVADIIAEILALWVDIPATWRSQT